MNKRFLIFHIAAALLLFTSCKSEYDRYVKRELNSGVKNDSLIFGMFMGQTKRDFFSICWDLNKQKLISQGTGNQMAKYLEPIDSTGDPTLRKEMEFYGIFDTRDVMRGMNMVYRFTSWSPWTEERHSKFLAEHLKELYLQSYPGNDFITIELNNTEYSAFAKIDGNRQILIYPINSKDVAVKMEDLNYKLNN